MRLSLLTLLLLGAATPVMAQPLTPEAELPSEAREAREPSYERDRQERRSREDGDVPRARSPEAERPPERLQPRAEASDPVQAIAQTGSASSDGGRSRQTSGAEGVEASLGGAGQGWREGFGRRRDRARIAPPAESSPVFGSTVPSPVTVVRPGRDVSTGSAAEAGTPGGRTQRDRIAGDGIRRDRFASEQWRSGWRQDRRYDWRRHRDRDRSRFHLGIYIDPFGWNYRDWNVGWRLPTRFYASRYWIVDPWSYRLPPVSGPYRWIRYHNDVLLVDLRSGRVLDRIRHFFW